MGSVNKVILVGHLGRDPEFRAPDSMPDAEIATISIATSETWKDRHSGERREKTEWHRVVIFNPHLVETARRFLRKGSPVYIEGALQTRKWTARDGVEKYATEVVIGRFKGDLTLLASAPGSDRPPPANSQNEYGRSSPPRSTAGGMNSTGRSAPSVPGDIDDDIPF